MRKPDDRIAAAALALTLLAGVAGCAAQTPEERVTELRADYEATLNSFQVRETPLVPPVEAAAPAPVEEAAAGPPAAGPVIADPPAAGEEGMVAGEEGALAGDEEPAAEAAPVVRQDVVLDIVITHRGDETLPGLTLDVTQADVEGREKTSYRIWVDTSNIPAGSRGAIAHRLEDVDYAPGDGFHVEVRQAIPPEQRGEYRELDEAGAEP